MTNSSNPFFETWSTPLGAPPFDRIKLEHYMPAFEEGLRLHDDEIILIESNPAPPSFENMVEAMERGGLFLDRVCNIFYNLSGTDGDEEMQAIERDMAPRLADHSAKIFTNPKLYARIEALYETRQTLNLNEEQMRVLEEIYRAFRRSGAHLGEDQRNRLREIAQEQARLTTQFSQNVLKDEAEFVLFLDYEDVRDLPGSIQSAAQQMALERGQDGRYAVNLSRSYVEPFLTYSPDRALRETLFSAWIARGSHEGAQDNRPLIRQIVKLREEKAHMLGFATYTHYKLDDTMAETPEAVETLFSKVWPAGRARAQDERRQFEALMQQESGDQTAQLEAYDWRYYAEKVRKLNYDFDESILRPYFELNNMRAAMFDVAHKLFGLSFNERHDLPIYHPQVRIYEVKDANGAHIALFYTDDFARTTKRGGAWMSNLRPQKKLDGDMRPQVINVLNLTYPGEGKPVLLSLDELRTMFHEFGHALHGMLSNVTYPWLSGTSVSTDFVELPSQLFEHWALERAVLNQFARHVETGEPLPTELIDRLINAKAFNQGFLTTEYCAAALLDLKVHLEPFKDDFDIDRIEQKVLAEIDMPHAIVMRHRPAQFNHIFSSDGYASGYYSYLWSEVLDADAFEAFMEKDNLFDVEVAAKLRDEILSVGNKRSPMASYMAFRGRLPEVAPLLRKRGLAQYI